MLRNDDEKSDDDESTMAQTAKTDAISPNRSCIVTRRTAIAVTSQALTNLVFLVRRKDQPLDKSVFIRKEEKPSSIYQPCPTITRSLSPRDLHSYPEHSPSIPVRFFDRPSGASKFQLGANSPPR